MDARYQALLDKSVEALGIDASAAAKEKLDKLLQPLAAELVLEWLAGEKRFESQSQQTEYWLSRFYDAIYTDEQPDATRIYARFGLTLPRAGYVARLLRARHTATWRAAARIELTRCLKEKEPAARKAETDKMAHITEFDIGMSPGAADELRVAYDRLVAATDETKRPRPPKIKPSFGGLRWFAIPADTLLLVLKEIK